MRLESVSVTVWSEFLSLTQPVAVSDAEWQSHFLSFLVRSTQTSTDYSKRPSWAKLTHWCTQEWLWSPRQLTHFQCAQTGGIHLLPLTYTPDRRDQRLLVSHPKDTEIHNL